MYLRTLSNDELLRIAHAEISDLTSTPLELELLRRLQVLADEAEPLRSQADNFGVIDVGDLAARLQFHADRKDAAPLLDVLADAEYHDAQILRRDLDRIAKFDAVMNDLAQPLTALQQLTEPA